MYRFFLPHERSRFQHEKFHEKRGGLPQESPRLRVSVREKIRARARVRGRAGGRGRDEQPLPARPGNAVDSRVPSLLLGVPALPPFRAERSEDPESRHFSGFRLKTCWNDEETPRNPVIPAIFKPESRLPRFLPGHRPSAAMATRRKETSSPDIGPPTSSLSGGPMNLYEIPCKR